MALSLHIASDVNKHPVALAKWYITKHSWMMVSEHWKLWALMIIHTVWW